MYQIFICVSFRVTFVFINDLFTVISIFLFFYKKKFHCVNFMLHFVCLIRFDYTVLSTFHLFYLTRLMYLSPHNYFFDNPYLPKITLTNIFI